MNLNILRDRLRYFATVFKGLMITVFMLMSANTVQAASFDCQQAKLTTEKSICNQLKLNDADVKLATTYHIIQSLVPMGTRGAIQDEQGQWLKQRNQCKSNIRCLSQSYQTRQTQLDSHLQRIREQGPF